MAGAKETPRQQMINLMYLVLTALLALQVSSSIIDKFIFLNDALETSTKQAKGNNEATLEAFKKKIQEEGTANKPEYQTALNHIEEIMQNADKEVAELEKLKNEIIEVAGGGIDKETGKVKNATEETKVEELMVGTEGSRSGKGYKVEKDLNAFVAMVNQKAKMNLPNIAQPNKDKPIYKNDAFNRDKDYTHASFGQTPVPAALAVLTHAQNQVRLYAGEAIKKLTNVDAKEIKFDKIQATASLESAVIASGQRIKGDMFLFASASQLPMKMTVNGSPIKVENGLGKIDVAAAGAGKHTLVGEISVNLKGKDTTFRFEREYQVVQPEITVISSAVNALYESCGNEMDVICPSLGANYNPVFSASNAVSIKGARKEQVILVPNVGAKKVNLSVSSGGQNLGTREFSVRKVPAARIMAEVNGREFDPTVGIPAAAPFLNIKAVPDQSFAEFLPKEANYRIENVKVRLNCNGRPVPGAQAQQVGGNLNLKTFAGKAKAGCTYVIEVTEVKRTGLRGLFPAAYAPKAFAVPLG